ncbi:MAG: hypothetical protein NCW75_08005 [Phycisphaera sp.]|nr:MAG: hypothetical protein NCW75_08005 [Phycisphaera sp.]
MCFKLARRFNIRPAALLAVALAFFVPASALAQGENYISRVNASSRAIPNDQRADLVLFPAMVGMAEPPAVVSLLEDGRPTDAMLLGPGLQGWDGAAAWAAADSQQAVVTALDEITEEASFLGSMVMAQPYGIDGVPVDLIRAGLYTELGDPPTLTTADFRYLPKLTNVSILAHVEASRRLSEGDPAGALDVLIDLMHLGRMMANREFFEEVAWGYRTMIDAAIRVRDVAYVDYTSNDQVLDYDQLMQAINRLDLGRRGFLMIDRLRLPEGDHIGGEQILSRIFDGRGRPTDRFAPTMSALTTSDRPLRRFSEAGLWNQVQNVHGDGLQTRGTLSDVFNDWSQLWTQSDFAPGHKLVREYDRLNPITEGVVMAIMPEMTGLFNDRRILRTEIGGTRSALGVMAYRARLRTLPVSLSSLQPQILPEREIDPFGPVRDVQNRPLVSPFQYLVPKRDLPIDPRVGPQPLPIDVIMLNQRNFGIAIGLDDEEFVIWSTGPDSDDDTASRVRENTRQLFDGDYLIWPPVISLYREFLQTEGVLR